MSYSEIIWANLTDMLLDMAAVLFVMTIALVWAVRTNHRSVPPPPSVPAPEGEATLPGSAPSAPDSLPAPPVSGDPAWK
jgi:hypothetical protein